MAGQGDRGPLADGHNVQSKHSVTGTVKTSAGNSQFYSKFGITLHNTSLEESSCENDVPQLGHRKSHSASSISTKHILIRNMSGLDDSGIKFPKLQDCAHFHYDYVDIGPIQVTLSNENQENLYQRSHDDSPPKLHFYLLVTSRSVTWTVRRTYDDLRSFDKQLHRCIYDRKFSMLPELRRNELTEEGIPAMKKLLLLYLSRFSSIAENMINCGPVLCWLELDNRGNRLMVSDDSAINTPAVAAAHVVKRYSAQDQDEISFEVGDIVSIIDMPPGDESVWWRGKKGFEVGFFPAENVELISEKLSQAVTSQLPQTRPKPVLRKHGKLISLLRNFFTSRPARTQLKRTGIVKERVFGCDLGEHLLNTAREIPLVLECCTDTIETHGIVDGIYRLSGVASNIQRLRNEFDEERVPCLTDECYLQDIHSISSLLKAYFRDLPNPLFTFQLYDKFISAIQDEDNKLARIHDVIQQLPPPHYRTAKSLMSHLLRVSQHGRDTGMHCKNLAIVWAPNLLRCKDLELHACSSMALHSVGVQAIVTEYLISHADLIFSDQLQQLAASAPGAGGSLRRGRPKSLAISTPTKLLSLEEARQMVGTGGGSPKQKYIEVGGGPSTLPDTYHTVIDLPHKKKSRKDRKSPSGWRSIFSKKGQMKVKDTERSDSVDSMSSGAVVVTDGDAEDYDDEDITTGRLRTVRSADSLLNESKRSSTRIHGNRHSDNISDSTTFINPYADGFHPDRNGTYSLDRMPKGKATKRSISADNSYSESEMEPIVDMSPGDDVFVSSGLDDSESPRTGLMSELESRLQGRSVSTSPKEISRSYNTELGSMPALLPEYYHEHVIRPKSQLVMGSMDSEHGPQPLMPKRSKSTAWAPMEISSAHQGPTPAPRAHAKSETNHTADQALTVKVKIMSPGKRKKAKAPLPPIAPPRRQQPETHKISPTARSVGDLVTIELMESPGVRRKLLYSAPTEGASHASPPKAASRDMARTTARDLETQGTEGAPGEMAHYETNLTDDEAFNTQNLSLTTDSETEVEKRESLSVMEDIHEDQSQVHVYGNEGGVEASSELQSNSGSDEQIDLTGEQRYVFPTHTELQIIEGYNTSGSGEMGALFCFDQSSIMEKSLDSMLKHASEPYYSSDELSQQEAAGASFAELLDSNSDGQQSGATMSTNFTTSSERQCISSTSEEDLTSAQVYAANLRTSATQRPQYIRKSLVDYSTTSESDTTCGRDDTTSRDNATPVITHRTPEYFPTLYTPSDSDTEIAKTPEDCSTATGLESSDQMTPNIELSDSEVVFVDPHEHLSQDGYEPTLHVTETTEINDFVLPLSDNKYKRESDNILQTPLEDAMVVQQLQAKLPHMLVQGLEDPSDASHSSDSTSQCLSAESREVQKKAGHGQRTYGDGYLADRSSSSSPTFGDVQGKLVKKKASHKDDDLVITVEAPQLKTVKETTNESENVSEPQTLSSSKILCHPIEGQKDLKKSVDSLLFEMEDLDSNMRDSGRSSIDKLNFSSENDDVFFRSEMLDSLRSETNMSISPDNYLEGDRTNMHSVEDIPTAGNQVQPTPIISKTAEYQVRSAAALDRERKGAELARKQSVRELLSKFESSTPSEESSDDTAKGSATEATTQDSSAQAPPKQQSNVQEKTIIKSEQKLSIQPTEAPLAVTMSVSPVLRENRKPRAVMRKPSAGISDRIKSFHSGYSSSEESEPIKMKGASLHVSHDAGSDVSTDSDRELSSSPRIHDLRRRFEDQKRAEKNQAGKPQVVNPTAETLPKLHIAESSESSSSTVNKDTSEDDTRPPSLVERMELLQRQQAAEVPTVLGHSTEATAKEAETAEESEARKSSLSVRLQSLSDRFRSYDEATPPGVEPTKSSPEPQARSKQDQKVTQPVPKPRSRAQRQPLSKGQFFTRYGQPDVEPVNIGASGKESASQKESVVIGASGSANQSESTANQTSSDSVSSLLERRRRFESFGVADASSDDSSKHPIMSASLPRTVTKRRSVANTGASTGATGKPEAIQEKSVVLPSRDSTETKVTSSWQQPPTANQQADIKAATLPRGSSIKTQEEPLPGSLRRKKTSADDDDKHVSVRDLSRQFERQLSEQSDSSRASSTSRTSGWNFASSDVANGNTPVLEVEQNNQNLLNQNIATQNWTSIL